MQEIFFIHYYIDGSGAVLKNQVYFGQLIVNINLLRWDYIYLFIFL